MKIFTYLRPSSLIGVLFLFVVNSVTFTGEIEDIQVLKISAQDERAIIKTRVGKMQVIKVGDPIGPNGKVIEIAKDRVVVEKKSDRGVEKVIIRVENGKQHVERITRTEEKQPVLYSSQPLKETKSDKKLPNKDAKKSPKSNRF